MNNPLNADAVEGAYFLYHKGGPRLRAVFSCANDAYVWQEGNRGRRSAEMFFITDVKGEKVVLKDQERYPGHAYAILEAMAKHDKEGT